MKAGKQQRIIFPQVNGLRYFAEVILEAGNYHKKVISIIILFACLIALELLSQLAMAVSHIDFTTFITMETFILTNITAFIRLYEFLENRSDKSNERYTQ